ncbi:CRAL-TRIO domain-containing protein [Lophiotrema nucula]|uniref:CRAL-TRIO domain-containing protein n=1 Tax=Lophiotrema nucula TaxID=690887 RepID=A0A6A5ZTA3_9PLEO|nr:CRAL-TRIO domain-containing protein [Lophiotrema nucula]
MADLKRVESFQYPAAHLGHLTDNQQLALESFKQIAQDGGYYRPPGAGGMAEASHDDETMLRFLRARRFNPLEAFKQFKDTEDWRNQNDIVGLYSKIDAEEYEATRRLYPQWLGRRDKRGIPLFLFEVAPLNSKTISAYEKSLVNATITSPTVAIKNLRLFALYESLTRFVMPLCSAIPRNHPETPISMSNNIVDISGVGLKQFWNLKGHMQDASQLATAHYPETLDRIFIIGAPAFFPTVWGWIKRWFDPITVSKIFILSPANVLPTLSQYIDVENIPKKYGGKLDFEFGSMPNIEPEIEAAIKWENPAVQNGKKTLPIGPIRWSVGEDGSMKAVAVGSEKGSPRHTTVFTIPKPVNAKLMYGPAILNTPIAESELALTTVGTHTQPPDPDPSTVYDVPPPSDSPTPSATPKPEDLTPATSVSGQATEIQPTEFLPIRQGTSDTRYEQQDHTHASGQLEDGTPHAAVNDHGHGDKTVTMEPSTVGQAPKDVSIKPEEPPAPGYLDQARQLAASATATVTSTVSSAAGTVGGYVGGGPKTEEKAELKIPDKSPEQTDVDAKIDSKEDPTIEGFLRTQTGSKAA